MTCNQLITLLQIYRGHKLSQIACGTTNDDLRLLRGMKLIDTEDTRPISADLPWEPTEAGDAKIRAVLTLLG